jgi:nucleoid-associated protein YgaU
MEQGVRILAACGVLAGGVLLAMLFRHQPGPQPSPGPDDGERLVLRRRADPPHGRKAPNTSAERPSQRAASEAPSSPASPTPTVLTPLATSRVPPDLAREYPGAASMPAAGDDPWSRAGSAESSASGPRPRTHKIVDGDTLPSLAERYLGSADRASEFYQANRDVLPAPAILPIGAELKIPPPSPAVSPSNYMPKRPLVPVVQGSGANSR